MKQTVIYRTQLAQSPTLPEAPRLLMAQHTTKFGHPNQRVAHQMNHFIGGLALKYLVSTPQSEQIHYF